MKATDWKSSAIDEPPLAPLDITTMRIRMDMVSVAVWPDAKLRQNAMSLQSRYDSEWTEYEITDTGKQVVFFRTRCRLMQIKLDSHDHYKLSMGMMRLSLGSWDSIEGAADSLGVFPFRPRRLNGKVAVPVPEFLVEARPNASVMLCCKKRRRHLAALIIFDK